MPDVFYINVASEAISLFSGDVIAEIDHQEVLVPLPDYLYRSVILIADLPLSKGARNGLRDFVGAEQITANELFTLVPRHAELLAAPEIGKCTAEEISWFAAETIWQWRIVRRALEQADLPH